MDLNHEPPDYESDALTKLSYGPKIYKVNFDPEECSKSDL